MPEKVPLEDDVSTQIFAVSAAMVGVCLTVIGLLRVIITVQKVDTLADDLLACDALLFLVSCLLSYLALRRRLAHRMYKVERAADIVFVVALLLMVGICGVITYALI